MLFSLLGIAVVLLPFYAVRAFADRWQGFMTVLVSSIGFHLLVALGLQSVEAFSYWTVFILSLSFGLAVFVYGATHGKGNTRTKADWFVILTFLLSLFVLVSVHFWYSGPSVSVSGLKESMRESYSYPMYSDEWIAVSLADYSIKSGKLPTVNPLDTNSPFINFLVAFHALIAELCLLLSLSPLTGFVWLSIAGGLLTCVSAYVLLRASNASRSASAIAVFATLFITNGGNFPSTWSLLPYHVSLICLLMSIYGAMSQRRFIFIAGLFLSLIFYPPMIVFVLPILLGVHLSNAFKGSSFKSVVWIQSVSLIVLMTVLVGFVLSMNFSIGDITTKALSFLVRDSLEKGIISFAFWNVLPPFVIIFIALALPRLASVKMLTISIPIICGTIYWIAYTMMEDVIIIEPSRVVAVTSLLLVIVSAFGIDNFKTYVRHAFRLRSKIWIRVMKWTVFVSLIALALVATEINRWQSLPLVVMQGGKKTAYTPTPPATRYLTNDDLRVFKGISGERFVAPPWKGLVIGVATNNFPLESKHSTLSNALLRYDDFMKYDCNAKDKLSIKYRVAYVYSTMFSCQKFAEIGRSKEGLVLYRFNNTD